MRNYIIEGSPTPSPTPENDVRIAKSLDFIPRFHRFFIRFHSVAKISILYTFYGQYALIYSTTLLVQDYTMNIYAYKR